MKKTTLISLVALFAIACLAAAKDTPITNSTKQNKPQTQSKPVKVIIQVTSNQSQNPIPCRVRFEHKQGGAVLPAGQYDYRKWFPIPGEKEILIEPGRYIVQASRGIETITTQKEVNITHHGQRIELSIQNWIDMNALGWWSGDMHIHRPPEVIRDLALAENLNVAPVLTFWNDENMYQGRTPPTKSIYKIDRHHYYSVKNAEHEKGDGAILIFNLKSILEVAGYERWFPDAISLIDQTHAQGGWVEIEKPFWNDYPLWLALGKPHSLGIVCNHFLENSVINNSAWGRPRESSYSKKPVGLAYYVMDLYYKALNCGFRMAATAGGASGVLDNPVGQNRTYVYLGKEFTYQAWFSALKKGRNFATNGPMLFATVNGKIPGASLETQPELNLEIHATALNGITRAEWVADGRILASYTMSPPRRQIRIQDTINAQGIHWLTARVFEDSPEQIVRFAHSSPFYIKAEHPAKEHQQDVQFFIDWLDERIKHSANANYIPDAAEREKRIANLVKAKTVFENLLPKSP